VSSWEHNRGLPSATGSNDNNRHLAAYTCTLSSDEGRQCGPQVTRWYYDSTDRKCATYTYFGCDGNSNNFATQQDCKEYCRVDSRFGGILKFVFIRNLVSKTLLKSADCPDGGSVYSDFTGQATTCAIDSDCPNTHYCTAVSSYERNIGFRVSQNCCPSKSELTFSYAVRLFPK